MIGGRNWSVIRVVKVTAAGAQKNERHKERKNESYANLKSGKGDAPSAVNFCRVWERHLQK